MQLVKKPKYFYGWNIVAVAFLTMVIVYGARFSFSVFYVAILEDFGWLRGETAGMFSINMFVYGLCSALGGFLIDKFGGRRVFSVIGVLLGLTFIVLSQLNTLWQFYLVYGIIMGVLIGCMGYVAFSAVLAPWFSRLRGTAMGIALAGAGVASLISIPMQYLITEVGWRAGFQIMALTLIVTIVPLSAIFLRNKPEDMGLSPDGTSARPSGDTNASAAGLAEIERIVDKKWTSTEWTFPKAVRTHQFWGLFLVVFLAAFAMNFIFAHQVAYCVDVGFSKMYAATIFGFSGVFSAVGFVGGMLSDRWGREWVFTIGSIGMVICLFTLMGARDPTHTWMLWVFAIGFGFFRGVDTPMFAAMGADLYQGKHFGIIMGIANWGWGAGAAVGGWLAGYIFDLTQSYDLAFILGAVTMVIAVILTWLMLRPSRIRLVPGQVR